MLKSRGSVLPPNHKGPLMSQSDTAPSNPIGKCACGETQFSVVGSPILRAICHCEICQEFNNAPYADITIFRGKDINLPEDNIVEFKSYALPPILQRGKCSACNQATIEIIKAPLMPKLTIVPSKTIADPSLLPEVSFHSFYHRRIEDATDNLPKYSGYLTSQVCFMGKLMGAMLRG